MFKVEIDNQKTRLEGSEEELLMALRIYMTALVLHGNVPLDKLAFTMMQQEQILEEKIKNNNKQNRVKTVVDNDDITVKEIDVSDLSSEEVKDLLTEIFNKRK